SARASTSTGGSVAMPSRSSATAANSVARGTRSPSSAGRITNDGSGTTRSSHALAPSGVVAADIVIRAEGAADHAEIDAVVRAAFARHPDEVALLVERIRSSANFIPELTLVSADDSGVIGHVMLSWVGIEDSSSSRILNLSPM